MIIYEEPKIAIRWDTRKFLSNKALTPGRRARMLVAKLTSPRHPHGHQFKVYFTERQ